MLDLTIHGDLKAVRRSLDRISTAMANEGYDEDLRGTVEIVLAEVMTNIVKHAYGPSDSGKITVKLHAEASELRFEITDEGAALPASAVRGMDRDFIHLPVHELPEGGFGWSLIRKLAQKLDYHRQDGRNHLSFQLPVTAPEPDQDFEQKVRAQGAMNN